jgi:serine/threonine protein kinase
MPPEAFRGRYSAQSDIWAAGILLYQMLSGKLPFPQPDIPSLYGAILTDSPAPLPADVPQAIQVVVTKALSKEPSQRFASAAEMHLGMSFRWRPSLSSVEAHRPISCCRMAKCRNCMWSCGRTATLGC